MNNRLKNNYFFLKTVLFNQIKNNGFTLIELLVVVIIVGVLAAIALPNFLAQIGKAREAEAKINLGVMSRAQQVYHLENSAFYNGNSLGNVLGVSIGQKYYFFQPDNSADRNKAIHHAYANDPTSSGARDFSTGVYFNAPNYTITLCVAAGVDTDGTGSSVAALNDGSCSGGSQIK